MIQFLEAPAGGRVSEAEAMQFILEAVNSNFRGFRGIAALCCQVVGRKGTCLQQGGCQRDTPCLLINVKQGWTITDFSTFFTDDQIIVKLSNLKTAFDMKRLIKKIKEDQYSIKNQPDLKMASRKPCCLLTSWESREENLQIVTSTM